VKARFHIGKLAQLSGRSVHAIRWYEAQGLLPNVGRDTGGRRVYEPGHVEHLLFLEWLKRTGMSVQDMREFTDLGMQGWRTVEARVARLEQHRKRVEGEMAMLQEALSLIDHKLAYYAEWMAKKKRPPTLLTLPAVSGPETSSRRPIT
jgi:DNA-binding transcriptional MerR regulator